MKLTKQQIKKLPENIKKQIEPIYKATQVNQTTCSWPSKDPVILLYSALAKKYGCYDNNGELTRELCLSPKENKMRFDIAFPRFLLAIEVDGWQYHHQLEAYKRDRTKQTYCLKKGWVLMRIMPSQITQSIQQILDDIEVILSHREYKDITVIPWGKSYYQIAPTQLKDN